MRGELNSNRWDLKPAWKEGMMFHFCCIWKGPIILMEMFRQFISGRAYIIFYQRKWIFFCQNDHNETTTVMSFKRTCAWNGIFDESALIHFVSGVFFSHQDLVPVWNFLLTKIIDMKSILVWVSFRLNSYDHKPRADWTSKWDFRTKLNLIPVWVHFASHVNVLLKRKQNALKLKTARLFL